MHFQDRKNLPWVDEKYVMMLDHVVDRFRIVATNPLKVVFRCPFCGDSRKSKTKARAALFMTQDGVMFKCVNCDHPTNLRGVLKRVSERMYSEYIAEYTFKSDDKGLPRSEVRKLTERSLKPEIKIKIINLQKLSTLDPTHPARLYWAGRMIPQRFMDDAYWCDSYYRWVNSFIPGKFSDRLLSYDCGRIVLPFRNSKGIISGYTGRSIRGEEPKYVAVSVTSEQSPFGDDRVDPTRTVYVVEGPIDSFFLDNCVAMGTSNRKVDYGDRVFVFDNEPRNDAIVAIVERAVTRGEKVVIWPKNLTLKDINDMVMDGIDVKSLVRERTFSGIRARIEFAEWRNRS